VILCVLVSVCPCYSFVILYQRPGGVVLETCVWCRVPAPPLVELDDAVDGRVEVLPIEGRRSAAGTPVHDHHRLALWVPALLVVNAV
jgi:hypothetical protein